MRNEFLPAADEYNDFQNDELKRRGVSKRKLLTKNFTSAVEEQFPSSSDNVEYVADTLHGYGEYIDEQLFQPLLEQATYIKPVRNS
jgi:putative N-acetylmannosamine-6-phosphate epimerase